MSTSRRSILVATGAGFAAAGVSMGAAHASDVATDHDIADLTKRSADAHEALMRGDVNGYQALITVTDDFTLMAPFGGKPTRRTDLSSERWASVGRFFRNGTESRLEMIESYRSTDMVVLACIERSHVGVGGLPDQNWALRVTLVFRREDGDWRLAHRHADPLAEGIGLELAAAIARGGMAK